MSKFQRLLFLGLIIVVGSLVYMEASKPEPVNWYPSYTTSDKIPLGTYVLDQLLDEKLEDDYRKVNIPPYEQLRDPEFKGNYFFVNNTVDFDPTEVDKILDWVSAGNNLFVSANYHSYSLMDTLKLEMRNDWAAGNLGSGRSGESII